MDFRKQIQIIFLLFIFLITVSFAIPANAGIVDDLKSKISGRADEIQELEKEIAGYQKELVGIGEEKKTLQTEIKRIDVTRKKLSTDIKVTENRIYASTLSIEKLQIEIADKEREIANSIEIIKSTIRKIDEIESNSLVELVLASDDISTFWDDIESFQRFQTSMNESVIELRVLKGVLEENRQSVKGERTNSFALKSKLSDQKKIEDNNRYRKDQVLTKTKSEESNYQKLLTEKEALKREFEKDLFDLESQLKIAIDPNSLPSSGSGILRWPLDKIFITQYFGTTEFSKSGAYNGRGHNGIDLRASTGTEVKSVLSGVVVETGNTDLYPGCYSYGKWILVRHNNGLTTLYAHLSLIKVRAGQTVSTGDVIGYSGNSGYSTGPHLHLTAYATQGVEVVRLGDVKSKTRCADARIPVAPLNAYLNPLDYL